METRNLIKAAAYYRISLPTATHGQSITNQSEPVREFAKNRGFNLIKEYQDEGISGATERRRGLDSLVLDARRGLFKTVIVIEISRLGRDVRHLLNLIHDLDLIGVNVVSIREGIDFNSIMGKAMLAVIGILMQVEKDLLGERIRTALAVKKQLAAQTGNGWRCGRPSKLTPELAREMMRMRREGLSIRQIARRLSVSKTTVQKVVQNPPDNTSMEDKNETE